MTALLVLAVVHLVVPAAFIAWQWRSDVSSRAQWLVRTAAFSGFLLALHYAGFWVLLPQWLSMLYFTLFAFASFRAWPRVRGLPAWHRHSKKHGVDVVFHVAFGVIFWGIAAIAVLAHSAPDEQAAALAFPLQGGKFAIASGGATRLMNFHLATRDDPAFQAVRGQSYALDIVGLNSFGIRARGLSPAQPSAYAIFGAPIHAPCDGRVLRSRDGLPDHNPPERDTANLAGNFVFLQCGEFSVLLAHMQNGSVLVREGAAVTTGQPLGKVGNSGNTTEPHLHMHAQRHGSPDRFLDGEPVPMRIDGKFLARNDRLSR